MDIFARLLVTFKLYTSASCGFVDMLLDSLLKILFDEPVTMLGRNWIQFLEFPDKQKHILGKLESKHESRNYLRPH